MWNSFSHHAKVGLSTRRISLDACFNCEPQISMGLLQDVMVVGERDHSQLRGRPGRHAD